MLCSSAASRWHALQQCRIACSAHRHSGTIVWGQPIVAIAGSRVILGARSYGSCMLSRMSHKYGPLVTVIIVSGKKAHYTFFHVPDILAGNLFPLHLRRAWVTSAALVELPCIAVMYWEIFHSFTPCMEDFLVEGRIFFVALVLLI